MVPHFFCKGHKIAFSTYHKIHLSWVTGLQCVLLVWKAIKFFFQEFSRYDINFTWLGLFISPSLPIALQTQITHRIPPLGMEQSYHFDSLILEIHPEHSWSSLFCHWEIEKIHQLNLCLMYILGYYFWLYFWLPQQSCKILPRNLTC